MLLGFELSVIAVLLDILLVSSWADFREHYCVVITLVVWMILQVGVMGRGNQCGGVVAG